MDSCLWYVDLSHTAVGWALAAESEGIKWYVALLCAALGWACAAALDEMACTAAALNLHHSPLFTPTFGWSMVKGITPVHGTTLLVPRGGRKPLAHNVSSAALRGKIPCSQMLGSPDFPSHQLW